MDVNSPEVQKLRKRMLNPVLFPAFMGAKLPLALVAGLRMEALDASQCSVSVPYRWRTTNPFRSTYFAALSMAAEMSTGALAISLVQAAPEPVSMLIVNLEAEFVKKATSRATFRCDAGAEVADAVRQTLEDGRAVTVRAESVGTDEAGDVVARFAFTWSFKKKRKR